MGKVCGMLEKVNGCRILVGNPEGERPLGRNIFSIKFK
jgi:hypothetical protein